MRSDDRPAASERRSADQGGLARRVAASGSIGTQSGPAPYRPSARTQAQSGWSAVAARYERFGAPLTGQAAPRLLSVGGAGPNRRVLDLCSGLGQVAGAAQAQGADALGVDFSPAMVALARERYPGAPFRIGDALALDVGAGSYDAVLCNFGLPMLDDPQRALKEVYRALAAGGRLAWTGWAEPAENPFFAAAVGALIDGSPAMFRLSDPRAAETATSAAGFVLEAAERVDIEIDVAAADALDLMRSLEPTIDRAAAQAPDGGDALAAALTRALSAFDRGGRLRARAAAQLIVARKPGASDEARSAPSLDELDPPAAPGGASALSVGAAPAATWALVEPHPASPAAAQDAVPEDASDVAPEPAQAFVAEPVENAPERADEIVWPAAPEAEAAGPEEMAAPDGAMATVDAAPDDSPAAADASSVSAAEGREGGDGEFSAAVQEGPVGGWAPVEGPLEEDPHRVVPQDAAPYPETLAEAAQTDAGRTDAGRTEAAPTEVAPTDFQGATPDVADERASLVPAPVDPPPAEPAAPEAHEPDAPVGWAAALPPVAPVAETGPATGPATDAETGAAPETTPSEPGLADSARAEPLASEETGGPEAADPTAPQPTGPGESGDDAGPDARRRRAQGFGVVRRLLGGRRN